jgi:hypothetical protein
LHGVVDRKAGGHVAPGRVDVQVDVLVGILRLQKEQLCDHKACDRVVERSSDEDNPLLQETRKDVVGSFSPSGLFNDHRDELVIQGENVRHAL